MTGQMQLTALTTLPMVKPEDDLAVLIAASAHQEGFTFSDGDIVCVAQKIVSKAEGRQVSLEGIKPSDQAIALAQETDKDPRLVQLVLDESTEVMRKKPGVLIVRHRLGLRASINPTSNTAANMITRCSCPLIRTAQPKPCARHFLN